MKDPAEILYPTLTPPQTPAPAAKPGAAAASSTPSGEATPQQPGAPNPAGDPPGAEPAPAAAAESDPSAGHFYDPAVHYAPALGEGLNRLGDHFELSKEQRAEQQRNAARIFSELEFEPGSAARFHEMYVSHVINQPDDATMGEWEIQTRQRLRERFGGEADKMLADARAYVATNKTLAEGLSLSGLGSHPEVVVDLVERVQRLLRTGRIKLPKAAPQEAGGS